MAITARAHTPDWVIHLGYSERDPPQGREDWRAAIDVTPWFAQASADDIMALVNEEWGGEQVGAQIAAFMGDHRLPGNDSRLPILLEYCERQSEFRSSTPELYVDQDMALAWLDRHRPTTARLARIRLAQLDLL